jgi:hypothetical protein
MEIDALGTFHASRAAFSALKDSGDAVIINISMTLHYGATWWQAHASSAKVPSSAAAPSAVWLLLLLLRAGRCAFCVACCRNGLGSWLVLASSHAKPARRGSCCAMLGLLPSCGA